MMDTNKAITIEAYGKLQELFPAAQTITAGASTVAELLEELAALQPAFADEVARTAVARGSEILRRDSPLLSEDHLALIPPVGGG